jgi:CO/xanthine dehydrogenase Mo-binding subunit
LLGTETTAPVTRNHPWSVIVFNLVDQSNPARHNRVNPLPSIVHSIAVSCGSAPVFHRANPALSEAAKKGGSFDDMGPGTWTSMTQVAADTLGLPIERVKFTLGDTRLPRAPVHGGSITMASVGSAVQAACRRARKDALAQAAANDLTEAVRRLGQHLVTLR